MSAWRARSSEDQLAAFSGSNPEFRPRVDPDDGRVKVGLWAPCCQVGGAETWQQQLARSVDPSRVAWAGLAVFGGKVDPAVAAGYEGIMPVGQGKVAAARLASACDVIVSWAIDDVPGLLSTLPTGTGPRVVSVVHAPIESEWGQYYYHRPAGIDRWAAVSELARDAIPAPSRVGRPVDVIWNAVDAGRMARRRSRAEVWRGWGIPADAIVAGFLQRLTGEKDPMAAARLAARLPEPWRVVVVGEGPMRDELDRIKSERKLDRMVIAGPDLEAAGALAGFDSLVVPSEYESFGLTIAEGLWIGVPVVSTPVGIAKLVPGMTREIRVGADGDTLAAAVLADGADMSGTVARVGRGRAFARDHLDPGRFGREWTEYLTRLAPSVAEGSACRSRRQIA